MKVMQQKGKVDIKKKRDGNWRRENSSEKEKTEYE